MLDFKAVQWTDLPRLRSYYARCDFQICEYSAAVKLMWTNFHYTWAEAAGCLLMRIVHQGQYAFDYPVAGPEGDEIKALEALEAYCLEKDMPLILSVIPEEKLPLLQARYRAFHQSTRRTWQDYLYRAADMESFKGHHYNGQRNHIRRFYAQYPQAEFRRLTEADRPLLQAFWAELEKDMLRRVQAQVAADTQESAAGAAAGRAQEAGLTARSGEKTAAPAAGTQPPTPSGQRQEQALARDFLAHPLDPAFIAAGMLVGGKMVSFVLGEQCGETMQVHIEKALTSYIGVYPATVQAFARLLAEENAEPAGAETAGSARLPLIRFFNREDDAEDRGLRISKQQYRPCAMIRKYRLDISNELEHISAVPVLETARLCLRPLAEADIPAYAALARDEARNRWWGYDYKADLPADWDGSDRYFYEVQQEDFRRKQAINWAITERPDVPQPGSESLAAGPGAAACQAAESPLLGEVLLYHFDLHGSAEAGVRISETAAGHGYGAEALAAVVDYGLYRLGLEEVRAKCFRENTASQRMLSTRFRPSGEDEQFFYFTATA